MALRSTELVLDGEPTSPRPLDDAVVRTLIRLIAAARPAYREPLLDCLYQYRRREGLFVQDCPVKGRYWPRPPVTQDTVQPLYFPGVGSGRIENDGPARASLGRVDTEQTRLVNSRRSRRRSL